MCFAWVSHVCTSHLRYLYLTPRYFVPLNQCEPVCTPHSVRVPLTQCVFLSHSVCIYVYLVRMRGKLTPCVYLSLSLCVSMCTSHSWEESSLSVCIYVYLSLSVCFFLTPCISVWTSHSWEESSLSVYIYLYLSLSVCTSQSVRVPLIQCVCTSHSVCVYLSLSLCVPVTQCVCTSHPVCVCLSLGVCVPLTQEMCTSHPDVLSPLFESHCFPMCFAWVSDVCMIHFTQKLRFLGTNLNSTHSPSYRHLVQIQIQSKQIQTDVVSTDGGDRTKNNHATAKISTNFHWSPRSFQTSFHGSPQNFKQVFTGVNRSPLIIQENCMIWRSKHLKSDLLRERDMTVSTEKWLVRVCVMCVALCWYVCVTCVWQCVNRIWRFPLEMLYPRNLPNREAQISRYTFKLNPNSNLNVWDTK